MTTLTVEALLQAIEECPNAIYSLGDPRSWILKRARELAAAQPSASEPVAWTLTDFDNSTRRHVSEILRDEAHELMQQDTSAGITANPASAQLCVVLANMLDTPQPSPQHAALESFAATRAQD